MTAPMLTKRDPQVKDTRLGEDLRSTTCEA